MAFKTRKEVEEYLGQRAARDSAFRKELIADPRAVIERETGIALSDGVKVEIVQEAPDHLYLVVPPMRSGELVEQDLEAVAGGVDAQISPPGSWGKLKNDPAAALQDPVLNPQLNKQSGGF
jgi:hypothetical protein